MKFKCNYLEIGQKRNIYKFLWLPKKIGNEVRWLEHAWITQKVCKVDVGGSMEWGKYKNKWIDISWR